MKTELELQKEFIENPELKEQLDFIKQGGASGIQGVVLVEAFLKGIRDLGYKDTAYALNEINDNLEFTQLNRRHVQAVTLFLTTLNCQTFCVFIVICTKRISNKHKKAV